MPAQNLDIFQTSTDALVFWGAPMTWTIDAGVLVSSTQQNGVFSSNSNSTLLNFGQVASGAGDGVLFTADHGTVVNEKGGVVTGYLSAVDVQGNHEMIDNMGSLNSIHEGVLLSVSSNNVQLINHGSIYGHLDGVEAFSDFEGGSISNFNTIRSDGVGVYVNTFTGFTTLITNAAGAVIAGPMDAIRTAGSGAIFLNNHGTLIGNIDCSVPGADNVIINHGKIAGAVFLGNGNDVFNGAGGASGAIYAGGGNDHIIAGKGNAFIHVGGGFDTLTGGPGHDRFIFDSALAGQVEKITNFKLGVDTIVLSKADFAGIGSVGHPLAAADFHIGGHATTHSQHIVYNANNGFLYYDPDGNGAMPETHFATISPHLALTSMDFLVEA